jgi:hypothetical protein
MARPWAAKARLNFSTPSPGESRYEICGLGDTTIDFKREGTVRLDIRSSKIKLLQLKAQQTKTTQEPYVPGWQVIGQEVEDSE